MQVRSAAAAAALAVVACFPSAAVAQPKPETQVENRQAAMKLMGKYFYGGIGPMGQGRRPLDATIAARNAGFIESLIQMPWDDFDARTKGVKSQTLPAVWEQPDKFKAAIERAQRQTAELVKVTRGGNATENDLKAAINELGRSCNGCHETFRERQ